jgi:hypothetical protein
MDAEYAADAIDTLESLGEHDSRSRRALTAAEAERHRDVISQLTSNDGSIAAAIRGVVVKDHGRDREVVQPPIEITMPTRPLELHSRGIAIRGTPFDFQWESRKDWGNPIADRMTGQLRVQADSKGTPGDTDHTWNAAGIGMRLRSGPGVFWVSISGFMPFNYRWHDDSSLEVARNRGELRLLVREVGGKTRLDHKVPLWNDGTSWWQEHGDEGSGVFNDSLVAFVEPDRDHELWVWFNSSIDYSHEGSVSPASSSASNDLDARLAFIMTEQYGV